MLPGEGRRAAYDGPASPRSSERAEGDHQTPSFVRGSENGFPEPVNLGFQGGSDSKESAFNAGDRGSIPGWGRSAGGGHGRPLQGSSRGVPWTEEAGWLESMGHKESKRQSD